MKNILELSYALDTFYFLISGAFVMWMAAGFAMLEAGLVRAKNTTEILTKNVALFSIACIVFMLVGYNLMYPSAAINQFLPNLSFLLGDDNTKDAVLKAGDGAPYYSKMADFFFQVVFVATAMSVVSGAVAERMKLWSFLLFAVVFCAVIYPIEGYWKWGGGFLDKGGFLDFAGSGIVHMAGAAAALAGVILLGPRRGKYDKNGRAKAIPGANMPMATLGMFILWFGWFGFNGGSELKISDVGEANSVALIFVNTNMAAAGGLVSSLLLSYVIFKKADLTLVLNGALAGLVSITAEPLTPTPLLAVIIGAIGGVIAIGAVLMFDRIKIDDPVGAISVHGVAGIWGLLAVVLSNKDASILWQIIGILSIFAWVFITSFIVWFVIKKVFGIRVSQEHEYEGVDMSECGVEAYPEFTTN
jgi:ammonium transporter, Amt family